MSVVVIAPHMDDEVLGCGGLLQRFRAEECRVVFVTEASFDVRLSGDGYVRYSGADRTAEMLSAARVLGYAPVRLQFPVHQLDQVPTIELIAKLEAQTHEADLVLVPAQSNDEDHNAVARACRALRRPHFGHFSILEYQTWGCPGPLDHQLVLPLSVTQLERKVEAMRCYQTQVAPAGEYDDLYAYSPESVLVYGVAAGRLAHADAGEAYVPIRLRPNPTTGRLLT
jgi:LmbE family N-acetylglucosaminyl deacetylase